MEVAPTIRIGSIADAKAVAQVHVTSWQETYRGIVPDKLLSALSVEQRAERWKRILGESGKSVGSTTVHVAEAEGRVVGFGSCGAQRTETLRVGGFDGEVSAIYILESFQHRGLGRTLMSSLAADLLKRGFQGVALWVLRDNLPARRFYAAGGGRVVAERGEQDDGFEFVEVAYGWEALSVLLS